MATNLTKDAKTIVQNALQIISVVTKNQPIDADDLDLGIEHLNDLLKAWQSPGIQMYSRTTGSISLIAETKSYAISSRPVRLQTVKYNGATGGDIPMLQMTADEYDELPNQNSEGIPTQFFYDRQREAGTVFVWPVKKTVTTETLNWVGTREVEDITKGSDVVDIPAEGYRALKFTLAAELAYPFEIDINTRAQVAQQAKALYDTFAAGERPESFMFAPEMV